MEDLHTLPLVTRRHIATERWGTSLCCTPAQSGPGYTFTWELQGQEGPQCRRPIFSSISERNMFMQENSKSAAPAAGSWGAAFLKQNAAAQASQSAAIAKEIADKQGGASQAPGKEAEGKDAPSKPQPVGSCAFCNLLHISVLLHPFLMVCRVGCLHGEKLQ